MLIEDLIAELEHEGIHQVAKDDPNVITLEYEIDDKVVSKAFRKISNTLENDIRLFQKERKIEIVKFRCDEINKDFDSYECF